MAYYLKTRKDKNIYLFNLECFKKESKFKDAYSLKEIDNFTTLFQNEEEMKLYLYKKGIISLEDINDSISIKMKRKEKLERVSYGLIYEDNKKYLDDVYMVHYLMSKSMDIDFLNKLISKYTNNYITKSKAASDINVIRNYLKAYPNPYYIEKVRVQLGEFYHHEVYNDIQETGETIEKYKSRHDLATFIIYLESQRKKENAFESAPKEECSSGNARGQASTSMVKKRVKKNPVIEGQMTMGDFFD